MNLRASAPFVMAVLVAELLATHPAAMAAPSIILFHGPQLRKPVFVADFNENAILMAAVSQAVNLREEALKGRAFIEVAMFWGPDWHQYVVDGKPLDALTADDANQHARIYPATDEAEALFVFNGDEAVSRNPRRIGLARWIAAKGLTMLERHSVIRRK